MEGANLDDLCWVETFGSTDLICSGIPPNAHGAAVLSSSECGEGFGSAQARSRPETGDERHTRHEPIE